jgi:hypothetical protein
MHTYIHTDVHVHVHAQKKGIYMHTKSCHMYTCACIHTYIHIQITEKLSRIYVRRYTQTTVMYVGIRKQPL